MSETSTTTKQFEGAARGRKEGSKNTRRALPENIHPEQMLSIPIMAELSDKSKSFFETNLSLARTGKKHTHMPPVVKIGRNTCQLIAAICITCSMQVT
jgi:hypothetical protein